VKRLLRFLRRLFNRTYTTCDGCRRPTHRRLQPVTLPHRVMLFCRDCEKNGSMEKARELSRKLGLGVLAKNPSLLVRETAQERSFRTGCLDVMRKTSSQEIGPIERQQAMAKVFRKVYGERG
jgi:hypothetical protein